MNLTSVTRLWVFDALSGRPRGIGRPPWESGVDDYLPPATRAGGENLTEALAAQTMGPLLIWAIRMIEDFADDIFAAWAERTRLIEAAGNTIGSPASREAVRAHIDRLVTTNQPVPTVVRSGIPRLAAQYLAGSLGAPAQHVHELARRRPAWREAVRRRPGPGTARCRSASPEPSMAGHGAPRSTSTKPAR
ncbi:hypothetical protein GCM10023196_098860 [Actinoallomurus vinaceus]|uniref:ER-bound oxygenase mpaB/mpaB'/Rubber oxygenase catalytic domain-containing protein n=1 Tax=Actinoallomurus vinaceus TaxID=1080074 RepID=A0ABP8USK2_9ACTN